MSGSSVADRTEIRALLTLDRMPGIGLVKLRALVQAFGSAAEALRAPKEAFRQVAGRLPRAGSVAAPELPDVDEGLATADRLGMEICTWTAADYPERLLHLHDPPPVLFLRGRRELLGRRAVTLVGARRATGRARDVSERLAGALVRAGRCVVSGMALGVDGAAHRGALGSGGDTLAVLGSGPETPYPRSHRRLFHAIVERGLVVSEFLPGTPPLPHNFPRRNRILAALSEAVVVVEAGRRSGSLITVDHALDLGVDVWAVPGPIEVDACAGSNRLLVEGALPLTSVTDFVREVTGHEGDERRAGPDPGGVAGRVLSALQGGSMDVDRLSHELDLSVPEALRVLTELELDGLVRQLPGMRFRRAA